MWTGTWHCCNWFWSKIFECCKFCSSSVLQTWDAKRMQNENGNGMASSRSDNKCMYTVCSEHTTLHSTDSLIVWSLRMDSPYFLDCRLYNLVSFNSSSTWRRNNIWDLVCNWVFYHSSTPVCQMYLTVVPSISTMDQCHLAELLRIERYDKR